MADTTPGAVENYLAGLPPERAEALRAVRELILKHLPAGYAEGLQYGCIGYFVPHARYPKGYHCTPAEPLPFLGLASTKSALTLNMFCLYVQNERVERFQERWRAAGKKLDMGASCVRFKKLADVPLDVVAQTVAEVSVDDFIAHYDAAYGDKHKPARKKPSA